MCCDRLIHYHLSLVDKRLLHCDTTNILLRLGTIHTPSPNRHWRFIPHSWYDAFQGQLHPPSRYHWRYPMHSLRYCRRSWEAGQECLLIPNLFASLSSLPHIFPSPESITSWPELPEHRWVYHRSVFGDLCSVSLVGTDSEWFDVSRWYLWH